MCMVTVLLDENDEPLGEAWVELMGLPETGATGAPLAETMEADLADFLSRAEPQGAARRRQAGRGDPPHRPAGRMEEIGKKPEVTVVVSRLQTE